MILEVSNLHKSFKGSFMRRNSPVIKGISLEVKGNEIFGYLGPNGAGKTTTLKLIMGLIKPDSGSVSIMGSSIKNPDTRADIGFLPENPAFYPFLTAYETLKLICDMYDLNRSKTDDRIKTFLSIVGLKHAMNRKVGTFSKGMVQRLGIAQAIINDPELIILDEPLSGLDPIGRKEVRDIILMMKKRGKTVLFSSHILPDIEMIADRVSVIYNGEIVGEGNIRDIINRDLKEIDIEISIENRHVLDEFRDKVKFYAVRDSNVYITVEDEKTASRIRDIVEKNNGEIIAYMPRETKLEEYFMKLVGGSK